MFLLFFCYYNINCVDMLIYDVFILCVLSKLKKKTKQTKKNPKKQKKTSQLTNPKYSN